MRVAIVIPALDEEQSIGPVVRGLEAAVRAEGDAPLVVVVDNGSSDRTVAAAAEAGAYVVHEPCRGYGAACLAGLAALRALPAEAGPEVVLFADGDGADDPSDVPALLTPLRRGRADLVIGSRALGERLGLVEPGSLTRPQRFGNALAGSLLRVLLLHPASDLGPFRAIRTSALEVLAMDDTGFGWTVQMQARAARCRLRVVEVPVRYRRRRAGRSKVSGDVRASVHAGAVILGTLFQEAWREVRRPGP